MNATGVSEPVVSTQGTRPDRRRAPRRHRRGRRPRLVGPTGRLDFVPLGSDAEMQPRARRPSTSRATRRSSAATSSQTAAHRPRTRRPAARSTSSSRTRAPKLFADYTRDARRRVLRDRARRHRHLGARRSRRRSPAARSRSGRRHRRLHPGRGQQPGHGPQVRLAAVPDRGAVERARSARRSARSSSTRACSPARSASPGLRVHAHATTGCRASSRASRSSTTRSSCYAIFRLIPVTLTLAGIAGFVLSVGMAVDANILIFERMKEELRARQVAAGGRRGRLRPRLELDPRLERVEPHHRDDPVLSSGRR